MLEKQVNRAFADSELTTRGCRLRIDQCLSIGGGGQSQSGTIRRNWSISNRPQQSSAKILDLLTSEPVL